MLSPYKSYFHTDFVVLKWFGGWIQYESHTSLLYIIYYIVMNTVFMGAFNSVVVIFWIRNTTNVTTLAAIGYVIFMCLMGQLKSFYLFINRGEFQKLIVDLEQDYFKSKNITEQELVKNIFRFLWKIKTALITLSYASVTSLLLIPLFYKKDQGLPVQAWYPFNASITPNYQLVYIHQAISIYYISSINIYVDVIIAGLCTFIGLQCDLICERVIQLGVKGKEEENTKDFVDCVNHHYTILEFLKTTQKVFGQIYFWQIFASVLALCMDMFLLNVTHPEMFELFYLIIYQLSVSNLILIPCWFATEMTRKSENIPVAAYSCNWINLSNGFKKELIIFTHRSQKPLKLYAANFFEMSVQTFVTIFRSSLSYYAVLNNLNMPQE